MTKLLDIGKIFNKKIVKWGVRHLKKMNYFSNIPIDVINGLSEGIYLGTLVFEEIKTQARHLLESRVAKDIATRLYSKSVQLSILESVPSHYSAIKSLGFGQNIAQIRGERFLVHACSASSLDTLPRKSQYKLTNAMCNPGSPQLNMFSPPISDSHESIYYTLVITLQDGKSLAKLMLPDCNYQQVLDSMDVPVLDNVGVEKLRTERRIPGLAEGVLNEYGKSAKEG